MLSRTQVAALAAIAVPGLALTSVPASAWDCHGSYQSYNSYYPQQNYQNYSQGYYQRYYQPRYSRSYSYPQERYYSQDYSCQGQPCYPRDPRYENRYTQNYGESQYDGQYQDDSQY